MCKLPFVTTNNTGNCYRAFMNTLLLADMLAGLMIYLLDYKSCGLAGLCPGWVQYIVSLGMTLYSHSTSLSAQVQKRALANLMLG